MQLHLTRSQKTGGMISKAVVFCLEARAQYTPEEQANIKKYKLGEMLVYTSENTLEHAAKSAQEGRGLLSKMAHGVLARLALKITFDSLGHGHHLELKDLDELLTAEEAIKTACVRAKGFLAVADSFDGRELVEEY